MTKPNRVWIELDTIDRENVDKANIMLKKLGIMSERFNLINHSLIIDQQGGTYLDCPDKGHWFNLDFIAEV